MASHPITFTHFFDLNWPYTIAVFTFSPATMSYTSYTVSVASSEGALPRVPTKFTNSVPPFYAGRESYRTYQSDAELWGNLAYLALGKTEPGLLVRLGGEIKNAASNMPINKICCASGLECVLDLLDDSYAVDESFQLDSQLPVLLYYTWDKRFTV